MTIDLTSRYATVAFMRGGPGAWTNNRTLNPVSRGYLHHTAGWYGPRLTERATEDQERQQIDAVAADHFTRFGIGPGYVYLVFPSGRSYAVGKWGTHRAHTKGRDPITKKPHNVIGIGVCAFGNYEDEQPTQAMLRALAETMQEVESYAGRTLPWTAHGQTPTVDSAGNNLPQGTACPGKNLIAWLPNWRETLRPTIPAKASVFDWTEFYRRGATPVRFDGPDAVYEVRKKVRG